VRATSLSGYLIIIFYTVIKIHLTPKEPITIPALLMIGVVNEIRTVSLIDVLK
jgi:hypothetical protein